MNIIKDGGFSVCWLFFVFHLKPKDFNHDSWTWFLGFFL